MKQSSTDIVNKLIFIEKDLQKLAELWINSSELKHKLQTILDDTLWLWFLKDFQNFEWINVEHWEQLIFWMEYALIKIGNVEAFESKDHYPCLFYWFERAMYCFLSLKNDSHKYEIVKFMKAMLKMQQYEFKKDGVSLNNYENINWFDNLLKQMGEMKYGILRIDTQLLADLYSSQDYWKLLSYLHSIAEFLLENPLWEYYIHDNWFKEKIMLIIKMINDVLKECIIIYNPKRDDW